MGGKVVQTNPQQAAGAYQGATDEARALDKAGAASLNRSNAYMTNMFGNVDSTGKITSSGTLSPFTDPNTLNTTGPSGPYQFLYNRQAEGISRDAKNSRATSRDAYANRGFSMGSGAQAADDTKLALGEAEAKGSAYGDAWNSSHQEALNNFWNANNLMAGQAAQQSGAGLQGLSSSASTYNNLYGTAGQGQYQPGIGAAILGGIGTAAGGLMGNPAGMFCPARGSLILMANGTWCPIEQLHKGDLVAGIDGEPDALKEDPLMTIQKVVEVKTATREAKVSAPHTFVRSKGGYSFALMSLGQDLDMWGSNERVLDVHELQELTPCYALLLERSHGYNVQGFWSLE